MIITHQLLRAQEKIQQSRAKHQHREQWPSRDQLEDARAKAAMNAGFLAVAESASMPSKLPDKRPHTSLISSLSFVGCTIDGTAAFTKAVCLQPTPLHPQSRSRINGSNAATYSHR